MKYYFLVTADKYELPVYIETSWRRLSLVSGVSLSTLYMAFARGTVIKNRYKVEVVNS